MIGVSEFHVAKDLDTSAGSVGHVHSDAFAEKWQVREVKDSNG